jgi:hypothetical protein
MISKMDCSCGSELKIGSSTLDVEPRMRKLPKSRFETSPPSAAHLVRQEWSQ